MYTPPRKKGPRRNEPQFTGKLRLRIGDTVRIISGKDKGKEGKISQVLPADGKVVIEGINIVTKHQKPVQSAAGPASQNGGRVERAMPLWACKVQLVDPADGNRVTRIGIKTNSDGSRSRVARKSGGVIDHG